jgi:hypothetical protein
MPGTRDSDNAIATTISNGIATISNNGMHFYAAADRKAAECLQ